MTSSYQWHTTRLAAASCVLLVFVALAPATLAGQRAPSLMLVFEAATPDDATARDGYQTIWAQEGTRIVAALRSHTGLEFQEADNTVHVVVVEEPSSSGFGSRPMRLRSSYSTDTKRATLIHELGHRLQTRFFRRDDEDHPTLFLYLYDVWVELYGEEFAGEQVAVESRRRGYYDYESAWREVLSISPEDRAGRVHEVLGSR